MFIKTTIATTLLALTYAEGSSAWVKCAKENQNCKCTGTVKYGAKGKFSHKKSSGSIACGNRKFGDPISGVAKSCYCKSTDNFGDLSFLNSRAAFAAARVARARFVKEHMRLAARRRHHTLAYFAAHHHHGKVAKLMHRFAKQLKARVAAHKRAIKARAVAKGNLARAAKARKSAHRAVGRARAHHGRAKRSVRAAVRRVQGADFHVRRMASALKRWRAARAHAIKKRQAALVKAHHWRNVLKARRARLATMIRH
jgi:hypothetical protein